MPDERLVELVTQRTGIELSRGGLREALDRYGEKRFSELGLRHIEEFIALLDAPDGEELRRLIEIISVPHTWFFRDPEQLDAATEILSERKGEGLLKIWVPACATGEDAYSLALICASLNIAAQIVGSDLSHDALKLAERGSYSPFSVRALPSAFLSQFRQRGRSFEIASRVKKNVSFVAHNLLGPPLSAKGGWDLILCRNVFIYFSASTSEMCASRLGTSLSQRGSAMFGAGELIGASPSGLTTHSVKNRVVYRKANPRGHGASAFAPSGAPDLNRAAGFVHASGSSRAAWSTKAASTPVISVFVPEVARESAPVGLAEVIGLAQELDPHPGSLTFEKANQELSSSSEAPIDPHKRMLSGIALYSAGDLERALHELRAASLLDEQLWPAAIYQGMCLESMGHPDLARTEFRHAVRVLEGSPDSYSALPAELHGLGPDLFEMARRKSADRCPGASNTPQ